MKYIIKLIYKYVVITLFRKTIHVSHNVELWNIYKKKKNKNNLVEIKYGNVNHVSINIQGFANKILFNGNVLANTSIRIVGEANQLIIADGVKIYNTEFVIRGNKCKIYIGDKSSIGGACCVCMGKNNFIKIGNECMLSEQIDIWATDSHPIFNNEGDVVNRSAPIDIGKHVWIGKRSVILKGVSVGDDCIIGMNSTVTKSIPQKTVCAGNPAKIIKKDLNWNRAFIKI